MLLKVALYESICDANTYSNQENRVNFFADDLLKQNKCEEQKKSDLIKGRKIS